MWSNSCTHTSMRQLALFLAVGALALPVFGETPSGAFEKPVHEQRIALAPDPYNPQAKAELRCFTYSSVLVKEIYRGEIGAELGLISLTPDRPQAACETTASEGQQNIDEDLMDVGQPGYFTGKIGSYLIFSAAEAWQGSEGVWVYSQLGNKLFADLTTQEGVKPSLIPLHKTASGQALKLRYRRVHQAQCSLFSDPQGCWQDIRLKTGLTGKAPDCKQAYQQLLASMPAGQKQKGKEYPSLIEYEVEVIIDRNAVTSMAPVSGATRCWTPE
jgi:hypothetical protein